MSKSFLFGYRPPFLCTGKIRQSLFNVYVSKDKHLEMSYTRTNITLPDEGTVSVDWATAGDNKGVLRKEPETTSKKRVCVIFPGLSGGSDKGYVKALVRTLVEDGFEVAVLHNRGVANTEYTSPLFADLTDSSTWQR